ncbi:MAG: ABC transporter substrate-binding protein [Alphaproteobacteria bacterium]|nr:ABC transporter substrate-binding protein [Alphaproteobacteria bacterium]
MNSIPRLLFGFWVIVAVAGLGAEAVAQPHVETSKLFIAAVTDEAINALTEKGVGEAELEERLRSVLVANLAVNNIGRVVLGRYWKSSTDADKREFLQLFQEVTVRAWSGRLGALEGQRFTVVSASDLENPNPNLRFAFVRTTFGTGSDQLPVDWQVATSNDVFKVTDVFVSGVSLVQAQKDEFDAVLRDNDGSLAALNDLLRERRDAAAN